MRFFVAGSGQFTLHIDGKVYEVLCEAGDLIGVPDGTRHWFDMSEAPYFVAIRLFTNKEGWVASFTGDDIAGRFPRMTSPQHSAIDHRTSARQRLLMPSPSSELPVAMPEIRAILTDIEGTTSSIRFVHDVLFPYARKRLPAFIETHADNPRCSTGCMRPRAKPAWSRPAGRDHRTAGAAGSTSDRKSTALKALQGMIWAEGYAARRLPRARVPGGAARLRAWHDAGIAPVRVFLRLGPGAEAAVRPQRSRRPDAAAGRLLRHARPVPSAKPTSYRAHRRSDRRAAAGTSCSCPTWSRNSTPPATPACRPAGWSAGHRCPSQPRTGLRRLRRHRALNPATGKRRCATS